MKLKKLLNAATHKFIFISIMLTSLILTKCNFQDVAPADEALEAIVNQCIKDAQTINKVVNCVPDPALLQERKVSVVASSESTEIIDGVKFQCTAKNSRGNTNSAELVSLNADLDVLYAGNLVQGKHLLNGNLTQVNGKRSGGTIIIEGITFDKATAQAPIAGEDFESTILDNLSDEEKDISDSENPDASGKISCTKKNTDGRPSYSCTVDEVNLSGIKEAREILLAQADSGATTSANIYYEITTGISFNQIKASLGIAVGQSSTGATGKGVDSAKDSGSASDNDSGSKSSTFGLDVEGSLEITKKESLTILKYVQGYYSIVWQPKNSPNDYFDKDYVLVDDIKAQIGAGNPAAYISSVTYGRTAYIYLFAKEDSTVISGALNAGLSKDKEGTSGSSSSFGLDINASGEYENALNESRMVAFFVGGSAADAAMVISSGSGEGGVIDKINDYIQAGAEYNSSNPGAPISYSVKWLASNERAKIALTQNYTETNCTPIDPNFRIAKPQNGEQKSLALRNAATVTLPSSDGSIYLYTLGGKISSAVSTVQKYQIDSAGKFESNNWISLENNALTITSGGSGELFIHSHTATTSSNKVYLIAGMTHIGSETNDSISNSVYSMSLDNDGKLSYDTITKETITLPVFRYGHSSLIANGKLYVIGGINSGGSRQATIYRANLSSAGLLDTNSSFSKDTVSLPSAVSYAGSFVKSNRLYVVGSGKVQWAKFERDDSGVFTGSFEAFQESNISDENGKQIFLSQFASLYIRDYIYIFGGLDGDSSSSIYFAKINSDGSIGEWHKNTKSMLKPRFGHNAVNAGGLIYILQGYENDNTSAQTVEISGVLSSDEE